jgi:hypothetical protein
MEALSKVVIRRNKLIKSKDRWNWISSYERIQGFIGSSCRINLSFNRAKSIIENANSKTNCRQT